MGRELGCMGMRRRYVDRNRIFECSKSDEREDELGNIDIVYETKLKPVTQVLIQWMYS